MASSTLDLRDGRIVVRAPYQLRLALKALGGWWEPALQAWTFPAEPALAHSLSATVAGALTTPAFDALARNGARPADARYTRDAPEIPGLLGHSWTHQRQAYADAMSRPATMLAMGMGAGKTRCAIGCILNRPEVRRVLILCPLSVVPVWPAEFVKHAGTRVGVLALDNAGTVAAKQRTAANFLRQMGDRLAVVVLNYESARMEPFRRWSIEEARFDFVVLDESQRCKRPGGVTSRYVTALGRRAAYRLCLSGTPAAHSPMDLFAQYRFLDPRVFGGSFVQFRQAFAILGGFEGREVVGYQNVEEFNRRYHSIAFQVGREVLDLPDTTEVNRYCELGAEGRRVYRDLEQRFYARLDSGEITATNALTALLRLQQLTGGYLEDDAGKLNQVDHAKRDLLAETLEEIGPEPIVVFCKFRRDLDTVHAVAGEDTLELSGRLNELARWQAGEGRVLAVQIQAGSVGISLVRAAHTILFSVGFSLGDYEQALARVHRPGQKRPVTVVKLIVQNTVDERVFTALTERRDVIETVLSRRDQV